jgi:hypothetical protein
MEATREIYWNVGHAVILPMYFFAFIARRCASGTGAGVGSHLTTNCGNTALLCLVPTRLPTLIVGA